ncbi:hypothetical protein C8Q77DRAFT_1220378 [Trametes polyzona]|nr:hypothetical protein C8Q77DRAFT_1220378 [Trametes polyzona]
MGDIKLDLVPFLSSATQYIDWSAKIKGLLSYVNCTKAWKKCNAQACGLIYLGTGQSFHYLLELKMATTSPLTAKKMWNVLQAKFGMLNSTHVWALFKILTSDPHMSDQKSLTIEHYLRFYIVMTVVM